jgi:hypothetical protein
VRTSGRLSCASATPATCAVTPVGRILDTGPIYRVGATHRLGIPLIGLPNCCFPNGIRVRLLIDIAVV